MITRHKNKALILFSIVGCAFILTSCSSGNNFLPAKIHELTLKEVVSADDARKIVDELHFQPVATASNEIGFYDSRKGRAVIYITVYEDQSQALDAYEKMTQKISPENSVFFSGEYMKISDKDVYRCFGMGQTHYVFYQGKRLFWISADTHIARLFLIEYLQMIRL